MEYREMEPSLGSQFSVMFLIPEYSWKQNKDHCFSGLSVISSLPKQTQINNKVTPRSHVFINTRT